MARPWVQGIGLHVEEGGQWRAQLLLPRPFLPGQPPPQTLPVPLAKAPMPGVLMHLKKLRPGLQGLSDLAGGMPSTLLPAAQHGPRAGMYLRQAQEWLKHGKAVLEPLAQREAWVLHYGNLPSRLQGKRSQVGGTALFVLGNLPGRNRLALELARLNPFSRGVRSRKEVLQLQGQPPLEVEAIRGIGGVFYLVTRPEGIWLFDRASVAQHVLAEEPERQMGASTSWISEALGARRPTTLASLWIIPQQAADQAFETTFKAAVQTAKPTSPNLAASPRQAAFTLALGGGPVAPFIRAATAPDVPDGPGETPEQKAVRSDLAQLLGALRLDTLNLSWFGWTPAPREAGKDPGLSPSVAAAVPLQAGKSAAVQRVLLRLYPRLFEGKAETRKVGGVDLVRIRTEKAFAPSWTVVKDHLVVGFSDEAVEGVAKGLMGQAPTLADAPPAGWGVASVDGPRLARTLEALLNAYLGAHFHYNGSHGQVTADEIAAEVATTFGPFLGALNHLGVATLQVTWKPTGLELSPQ